MTLSVKNKKHLHFIYSYDTIQTVLLSYLKEVKQMKDGIHPDYKQTEVRCACGAVIETGSTKENMRVDICSKCHPFFTGKQKLVDTGGRVDRFNKRFNINK